jgi:serine/threonine-protein kinase RsbW
MTITATHRVRAAVADVVDLRVPADPAYLAVIRTATAGLAARMNLTLDQIEDMRIAVDEACVLLMTSETEPGQYLHAAFTISATELDVQVSGPAKVLPEGSNFAWSVLEALVGQVETGTSESGCWIRLTHAGGTPHRP